MTKRSKIKSCRRRNTFQRRIRTNRWWEMKMTKITMRSHF